MLARVFQCARPIASESVELSGAAGRRAPSAAAKEPGRDNEEGRAVASPSAPGHPPPPGGNSKLVTTCLALSRRLPDGGRRRVSAPTEAGITGILLSRANADTSRKPAVRVSMASFARSREEPGSGRTAARPTRGTDRRETAEAGSDVSEKAGPVRPL